MSSFAFVHRRALTFVASVLLHGLALWAWQSGGWQTKPLAKEQPLRIALVSAAPLAAQPRPKPVSAAPLLPQAATLPSPAKNAQAAARPPAIPLASPPATLPATPAKALVPLLAPAPESTTPAPAARSEGAVAANAAAASVRTPPGPSGSGAGASTSDALGTPGPAAAPPVLLPSRTADYLHNPEPVYPLRSLRLGETGAVMLTVLVAADGRVRDASVKSSSGFERLDRAAREAVLAWTFVPGKRSGVAVDMSVEVPIRFKPQD